uniref:Peptidase A2 domain-containing protein n=1 Tax=Panagrolaimus davidi TaxID=227884 RepID=A0A914QKH6_9BILA
MMKNTNESRAGVLQQHDGYLGTNNTAVPDTPIWPLSMVATQAYAENCYMYTTRIFTRYGIPEIQSAFIAAAECRYQKGACNMEEDGVLLWQPDVTQNCKFIELAVWNGSFSSGVWIAENQDFALSFEEATAIQDCNITVVLADQGFAVEQQQLNETIAKAEQPRAKRDVGVVYSSQLAAEMTALQERTMQTTRKMFTATLHQICSTLNAIAEATLALAIANPTLLARQMLNETNIKARLVSARILEITACLPLDPAEVHFSPQEQCYNRLPVKFMYKHQAYQAFLDPITLILENHADAVPCEAHENLYLKMNKLQKFNQRTGHAEFVDVQHEITTFKTIDFPQLPEHGHVFKNLILANLSEIFHSNTFFKSAAKVQHMQMIMNKMSGINEENQQYQPHLDAYAAHVVSTGLFAFLYGGIKSIWQIWIFTCCVYITSHFMMHVLLPSWIWKFVKYLNIFNLIQKIKQWCDKRPRRQARWTPSTNEARINEMELEEMLTTRPERRFSKIQQKWPSTIIEVPQRPLQRSSSSILAISNEGRSPAHVKGTLDGNPCFYLLDTGAKRSIVNQEYVKFHRLQVFTDQPDIQLMGIEGRPVVTNGYIKASIQLAQVKIQLNLFIFPGPNRLLCQSDVILGEDAFEKLPVISFDYQNKEIYFGPNAALVMVDVEQGNQIIELQIGKTNANEQQQQQRIMPRRYCRRIERPINPPPQIPQPPPSYSSAEEEED